MARKSRREKIDAALVKHQVKEIYRVGAYIRRSVKKKSKNQNEDSLENQKAMIEEYFVQHPELKVMSYYIDNGKTGTHFKREAFDKLMEEIKNRKINCVVVKDLSRFGRDYLEVGNYLFKIFPFLGVRFISIKDNYDSLNPKCDRDFLLVAFKNLMHDYYAKDISVKVSSVLFTKRMAGKYTGSYAPYGYQFCENRTLVIEEETAKIVKRIFHNVLEGNSYQSIANNLNKEGILCPSRWNYEKGIFQKEKFARCIFWIPSTIKLICENQVYLGDMVQHKSISSLPFHKPYRKLPKEEWVVVTGTQEPIIDEHTFFLVQKVIKNRKEEFQNKVQGTVQKNLIKRENIFKKKLYCNDCGKRMKRIQSSGRKKLWYRFICSSYDKYKDACTKKTIPESLLMDIVQEILFQQVKLFVLFEKIEKWIENNLDTGEKRKQIQKMIERYKELYQLKKNEKRILYEKFVLNFFNEKEYQFIQNKLDGELYDLEIKLEKLEGEKEVYEKECFEKRVQQFNLLQDHQKISFLMIEKLIDRIDVCEGRSLRIKLCYDDDYRLCFKTL